MYKKYWYSLRTSNNNKQGNKSSETNLVSSALSTLGHWIYIRPHQRPRMNWFHLSCRTVLLTHFRNINHCRSAFYFRHLHPCDLWRWRSGGGSCSCISSRAFLQRHARLYCKGDLENWSIWIASWFIFWDRLLPPVSETYKRCLWITSHSLWLHCLVVWLSLFSDIVESYLLGLGKMVSYWFEGGEAQVNNEAIGREKPWEQWGASPTMLATLNMI